MALMDKSEMIVKLEDAMMDLDDMVYAIIRTDKAKELEDYYVEGLEELHNIILSLL